MVPCLLFRLLWVGTVALPILGTTESVTQLSGNGVTEELTERNTTELDVNPIYKDLCEKIYEGEDLIYPDDKNCIKSSEIPSCVLYPTNQIGCSWTLDDYSNESQYYATVFVCNGEEGDFKVDCLTEDVEGQRQDGVVKGNVSSKCHADENTNKVILFINESRTDMWCLCIHTEAAVETEKLNPPPNITAEINGTDLLVWWRLPSSRWTKNPMCFSYELWINDQKREIENTLTYKETNVDPTQTYNVTMRVKVNDNCRPSKGWSDWSNPIRPPPGPPQGPPPGPSYPRLIGIVLGIPMILLAIVMFIRLQRDCLFPRIPGPPLKVKHLLEKDNLFQFVPQVLPSYCVEEITVVEESEETPPNMDKITNLKT